MSKKINNYVFSQQKLREMGKTKEQSFVVTNPNNKPLEIDDIKKITAQVQKACDDSTNNKQTTKYMLRVLSNKRYTLKGYDSPLELDEYDDYFENKVKDPSKFFKFYEAQVIVKRTKK